MKIAVYTIAKNEEQFVKEWYEYSKDADYLVIGDTGSTDKTRELAQSLGIVVVDASVNPWRFDKARNITLNAIPEDADFCISIDMDERLSPGWRVEFESVVTPEVTKVSYYQIEANQATRGVGTMFDGHKAHRRHGFSWVYPVHEVVMSTGDPEVVAKAKFKVKHFPDFDKARSSYLDLTTMAVKEMPKDSRMSHYHAKELVLANKLQEAKKEYKRYLSLHTSRFKEERAAAMTVLAQIEPEKMEEWVFKAILEAPGRREPFVILANHYLAEERWFEALTWYELAFSITEKATNFGIQPWAWDETVYSNAATAAFYCGRMSKAIRYTETCIEYNPENERYKENLKAIHSVITKSD